MGAPKATDTPAAAAADNTCEVKGQQHVNSTSHVCYSFRLQQ